MDLIQKLDEILLSDNVVENFYSEYNKNEEFKTSLLKILPEVEACEKQRQNNPWHKYNVLKHILYSVEEMNKQSKSFSIKDRRILAYTMFLHDIGKPARHITRTKNGQVIDSFFDHNIESEKVAQRVLDKFGFNEKEIKEITALIYKHDIFMFIKDYSTTNPYHKRLTNDLINEEICDLDYKTQNGEEVFKKLVLVGRADNFAQNEKMTGEALMLLDKIEYMLGLQQENL